MMFDRCARTREPAWGVVALLGLLALGATGCMGYRDHYDLDADRYKSDVLGTASGAESPRTQRTARPVVHVACFVAGERVEPVSAPWPTLEALAARTVRDMGVFEPENTGRDVVHPDYLFVFDVRIEISQEPGLFSGLILPFYRVERTTVRLQVLDDQGEPFANYITSAETFEARHIFLLPLTPFYWPGSAERRARRGLFEALAVKLVADRKEFL